MSVWDEVVFQDEDNIEFLDELVDMDQQDIEEALEDAVTLALRHAKSGEVEYSNGLCAASVAAIWCGAPFSSATIADEHPFVRQYIGQCSDSLQERASTLLDRELELHGEDAPEGLETFSEALT